jgi:hypothetical protein
MTLREIILANDWKPKIFFNPIQVASLLSVVSLSLSLSLSLSHFSQINLQM